MKQQMSQKEFNELLPTIPSEEKRAFQQWYIEYQDEITWEEFKCQGYRYVVEAVEAVRKHVEKETGDPKQDSLAFMPTELARTSPFFPIGPKEKAVGREYSKFKIENKWGSIELSGPKLSIFDESVLLALLVMARERCSLLIETTYVELCKAMHTSRGVARYKAIEQSLSRLGKTSVETSLMKIKNGERVATRRLTGPMMNVNQDLETKKIKIRIDEYFQSLYGKNLVTALDIKKRIALRGDVSKALFRFLMTHKPNSTGRPGFRVVTLAAAINLDADKPLKEIRRQLRTALNELSKHGHIKKDWKINKEDVVIIPK